MAYSILHTYYTGPQRVGEDGLQSGHLQLHDHWVWEARHQGLHLDPAQDKGGVGLKLKVDFVLCHHCVSSFDTCLLLIIAAYN